MLFIYLNHWSLPPCLSYYLFIEHDHNIVIPVKLKDEVNLTLVGWEGGGEIEEELRCVVVLVAW